MQADSSSDSDSESLRKECPLFNSTGAYSGGRLRRVGADSRSLTVYRNDFLILVPTLGIGVGTCICLHYTRTLTGEVTSVRLSLCVRVAHLNEVVCTQGRTFGKGGEFIAVTLYI